MTPLMPDFAWVWWDYDAGAWVTECWACEQPPFAVYVPGAPRDELKAVLVAAAERHNQERHTGSLP
mgnify:FL=1